MKIYIVEDGSYSDKHIEAIYSTEELAQKALDAGSISGSICEYELDPPTTTYPILEQGWRMWDVYFDREGNVEDVREGTKETTYRVLQEMEGCHRWNLCSRPKQIIVCLLARDREHAIKSANEKRIMVMVNPKLWNPFYYHNNENFQIRRYEEIK